jgi:hypothetical protein
VHSYYHLVITLAPCSLSGLPTLVCFLVFHRLARKHLALLADVVSGFKSFSEAPCLAKKCGTRMSHPKILISECEPFFYKKLKIFKRIHLF